MPQEKLSTKIVHESLSLHQNILTAASATSRYAATAPALQRRELQHGHQRRVEAEDASVFAVVDKRRTNLRRGEKSSSLMQVIN